MHVMILRPEIVYDGIVNHGISSAKDMRGTWTLFLRMTNRKIVNIL